MWVFVAVVVVWLGLVALWVVALVSVTHFPSAAFDAVGRSQGATFALVAITGWLGAIYYWLVLKRELEPYRDLRPDDNGLTTHI